MVESSNLKSSGTGNSILQYVSSLRLKKTHSDQNIEPTMENMIYVKLQNDCFLIQTHFPYNPA